MTVSRSSFEDGQLVEQLERHFNRRRLVHVHSEILVHERAAAGNEERCWCCGSKLATITQRVPDLSLLIDRVTGKRIERWLLDDADLAEYDRLAGLAEDQYIPLRSTPEQLPLLLSTAPITMASGGSRGGKSTCGIEWLVRRWMLRGGRGHMFYYTAPTLKLAETLCKKLLEGSGTAPSILPQEDGKPSKLVLDYPQSSSTKDQTVTMIDGSQIVIVHLADKSGKALKSRDVYDVLLDEGTEAKSIDQWTLLLNRMADHPGGQMFVSTTPRPRHFLKQEVVDKAHAKTPGFLEAPLSMRRNPWFDDDYIKGIIARQPTAAAVAREVDGLWTSDGGQLYVHFDPEKHVVRPAVNGHGGRTLADYGLGDLDITEAVVRDLFKGPNPYRDQSLVSNFRVIGGQDFNVKPCSTLIACVQADPTCPFCQAKEAARDTEDRKYLRCQKCRKRWNPADPKHRHRSRLWVFDEVITGQTGRGTNTILHCDRLNSLELAKAINPRNTASPYAGIGIICDADGCYNEPSARRIVKYLKRAAPCAAETMAAHGFDARAPWSWEGSDKPRNPKVKHSVGQMHALMRADQIMVHERCEVLRAALRDQECDAHGQPIKESGTASDRRSSTPDCLRYLAWAIYGPGESDGVELVSTSRARMPKSS